MAAPDGEPVRDRHDHDRGRREGRPAEEPRGHLLNFPTSNISSERVGAVLRADEAAWTRSQQSSGTVENDAKVSCNLVFVEAMLRAKIELFGTF